MRFPLFLLSLCLGCLGSCSGPSRTGPDAPAGASRDAVVRSYTEAIVAGMARARAERLREVATRGGRN